MKAIRFHTTGGPAVLVYEDAPDPVPADGEFLTRVRFLQLNRGRVSESQYNVTVTALEQCMDERFTTDPIPFRRQNFGDYEIPARTLRPDLTPGRRRLRCSPQRLQVRLGGQLCRDKSVDENDEMVLLFVQLQNSILRGVIKRLHFPMDVMLVCVRWYAAYALRLRTLEEMMAERGVLVDHATVHRWALKILPVLAKVFRRRQVPVGRSWRVDETYVRVGGDWRYLYRAVDRLGQTVDFLLTARRDEVAARRFFAQAIDVHDVPEKVSIDKSGANTAAVQSLVAKSGLDIELRQSKYLNNLVERDHRAIKRRRRPMMGFGGFHTAAKLLSGIETMHAIKKGQLRCHQGLVVSDADRFYSLATR